ncbi:hypothetical protein ACROYT_G029423 [Oculina patagonica]
MADVSTVTFSGSSTETIEHAKAFWKSIDPPPEPKSTLVVSGINHRLQTAPKVQNGNKFNNSNQAQTDLLEKENDPRLKKHLEDAQKRKDQEQADYVQRMTSFREEAQQTLAQRKADRLKKEEISRHQYREPVFNVSESSDEEEEIAEAMAEIDKFEETLKQKEEIKSE